MKKYDKISTYIKENILIIIPLSITALLFDGLMWLIPVVEGKTIDSILSSREDIIKYSLIFLFMVFFVQINRFLKRFLVRVFGNKISLRMRKVSFSNLLKNDVGYFSSNLEGDILNKILTDIADTTEGIRKITTEIFDTFVILIGYFVSILLMDYKVFLGIIPFIIAAVLVAHFMKKYVYKTNKDYKNYLSENKQLTITLLNNELYYRGYGVHNEYLREYEESVNILKKKNLKSLIYQSSLEPIYSIIALLGLFPIIMLGGRNVIDHVYLIGTLSALITTYLLVSAKAAKVGKLFNAYQAFKVSWGRCKEYLKASLKKTFIEEITSGSLVANDLVFGYDKFMLKPLTIRIKNKSIVGICGKVHCGKTSLLKAFSGIYGYSGSLKLGGFEVKNIVTSNKQYISYQMEKSNIFSTTIKENISLGRDGNIDKASYIASLDVEDLGGYDYTLSHSNSNLSGGEQSRLMLARALYGQTNIVLLDNPFRSVSPDMAEKIFDKLKKNNEGIIILATNNKKMLEKCDQIIFIDDDYQIGCYNDLLKNLEFRNLMEVQE